MVNVLDASLTCAVRVKEPSLFVMKEKLNPNLYFIPFRYK